MSDVTEFSENEVRVAKVVNEFKENKFTGKIEIGFKDGKLVGCNKQIVVLK